MTLRNTESAQFPFIVGTFPLKHYYLLRTLEETPNKSVNLEDTNQPFTVILLKVYSIENTVENKLGVYFPPGNCDVFVLNDSPHLDGTNIIENKPKAHSDSSDLDNQFENNDKKADNNSSIPSSALKSSIIHQWHSSSILPTQAGEPIEIAISSSSGIKANKSKKTFKKDDKKGTIAESYQLSITNKQERTAIIVEDTLFRTPNWELSRVTPENYYTVGHHYVRWEFPDVPLGEVQEIRYHVTYSFSNSDNQNVSHSSSSNSSSSSNISSDKSEPHDDEKKETDGFFSKIFKKKK